MFTPAGQVAGRMEIKEGIAMPVHADGACHAGPNGSPARRPPRRFVRAVLLLAVTVAALASAQSAFALTTVSSTYGPVYEHVQYGPRLVQQMNIFEAPASSPASPVVMLVHGGGWRFQYALSRFASEAKALQAQGFTVFDINYQQDSERRPAFPTEPNDVILATHWAMANAAQYHANAGNVVLVGGSAGGQLVGIAGEQMNAAAPGTVDGVVSLSGPMNLESMVSMVEEGAYTNEEFIESLNLALGRVPGTTIFASSSEMSSYPVTWSPALQVSSHACPAWLLFNSQEEGIPLSQAQEMASAARNAGCNVSLQVVPGSKHAFAYFGLVASSIYSFIHNH
ncbi:MAG TPA: alpha/beta hydrolase [Solirubrobacteraceae bacterium]|jgi:acetyl esterase/lipase